VSEKRVPFEDFNAAPMVPMSRERLRELYTSQSSNDVAVFSQPASPLFDIMRTEMQHQLNFICNGIVNTALAMGIRPRDVRNFFGPQSIKYRLRAQRRLDRSSRVRAVRRRKELAKRSQ
jgi:hypothetical protein